MSITLRLATTAALLALPAAALTLTAPPASAATLPPLEVVVPSPDGYAAGLSGSFILRGAGCLDSTGPGQAAVSFTEPDGTTSATHPVPVEADGTWVFENMPYDEDPPLGWVTAHATCDTYTASEQYPPLTFETFLNESWKDKAAITVSDATVTPGQRITVTLTGWPENEINSASPITGIFLDPLLPSGTLPDELDQKVFDWPSVDLADVFVEGSEPVSIPVTIPSNTQPGQHAVAAITHDFARYTVITVYESGAGTHGSGTGSAGGKGSGSGLASTGTHTGPLAALAIGVLVTGGAALAAGRRRTR